MTTVSANPATFRIGSCQGCGIRTVDHRLTFPSWERLEKDMLRKIGNLFHWSVFLSSFKSDIALRIRFDVASRLESCESHIRRDTPVMQDSVGVKPVGKIKESRDECRTPIPAYLILALLTSCRSLI
jgi:hypothetical protein